MKKLGWYLLLAFVAVIIFWLFKDPQGLAAVIKIILEGLRTAAERLITFVMEL